MLKEQIQQVIDQMLRAEVGTESLLYFSSPALRESARVRFILQKNRYEQLVHRSAPIAISRFTGPKREPGIRILRLSDTAVIAFMKKPGEASYTPFTIPQAVHHLEEITYPSPAVLGGTEETTVDEDTIRQGLREEGLTESEIDAFLASETVDFNPEELEEN